MPSVIEVLRSSLWEKIKDNEYGVRNSHTNEIATSLSLSDLTSIARGIEFLHTHNITHGNIVHEKWYIENDSVVVCLPDTVNVLRTPTQNMVINRKKRGVVPPECMTSADIPIGRFFMSSDIWMLGVLMLVNLMNTTIEFIKWSHVDSPGYYTDLWMYAAQLYRENRIPSVVVQMLYPSPARRPQISQVCKELMGESYTPISNVRDIWETMPGNWYDFGTTLDVMYTNMYMKINGDLDPDSALVNRLLFGSTRYNDYGITGNISNLFIHLER